MPAWSETERPRPVRWQRVGTAINFSIRFATAAVLPILHLNGYKIANPCFLARIPKDELKKLFEGYGYKPYFVEGHDPEKMHHAMAATLETPLAK